MAKITAKNIRLTDDERIYFGADDDAYIEWDEIGDHLEISTVASGVYPTKQFHLTTKEYVDSVVSGATSFIGLSDTPATYSGSAGYVAAVNASEDALEFVAPGSYNVDGGYANSNYGAIPALDGGNA